MPDLFVVSGLVAAYLLGSTPTAWLVVRLVKGIDLRKYGSGNLGATNVYRTAGAPAAVAVLVIDALKGAIPVLWFGSWFGTPPASWYQIVYGLLAVAGHVRPYFGFFRGGGKGVATASGMFWALVPLSSLIALAVFTVIALTTRFVSLGSMSAAVALVMSCAFFNGLSSRITWVAALLALFVIWNHRANIDRLRHGSEARIGRPGATA
ncbi:MAG: glycerol-3-phosphate 1-O-acyltransferase PlsY [Gemmatimonadota bacterium]